MPATLLPVPSAGVGKLAASLLLAFSQLRIKFPYPYINHIVKIAVGQATAKKWRFVISIKVLI